MNQIMNESISRNKGQSDAIEHLYGPCMVIAPPGSGKTYCLVKRIEYLLKQGISPREILVLTFSKAAAKEMQERFTGLCPNEEGVVFGTIHAVFYEILKRSNPETAMSVISSGEKKRILFQLLCERNLEQEYYGNAEQLLGLFGKMKRGEKVEESGIIAKEELQMLYEDYQRKCMQQSKIDFDDMLIRCKECLTQNDEIRTYWQNRFLHVLVDEFQDISPLQYELVRILAAPDNHIFVVGDDDQSIYGFRGAVPEIMLSFEKDYENARKIALSVSYRCGERILESAKKLISNNRIRFEKEIMVQKRNEGTVTVRTFETNKDQIDNAAITVKNWIKQKARIAVIARTNAELSRFLRVFEKEGIFCRSVIKSKGDYSESVICDVLSYFRMALGVFEIPDLLRIMNRPNRYISRNTMVLCHYNLQELLQFYANNSFRRKPIEQFDVDLRRIKEMPPYAAIQYIRKKIGYDKWVEQNEPDKGKLLEDFQEEIRDIRQISEVLDLVNQEKKEYKEKREKKRQEETELEPVYLMTMHASKGLEFDKVWIPNLVEGTVPNQNALFTYEIEEERRLLYVAMTRAKEELVISYYKKQGHKKIMPSCFLKNLS